VLLEVEVVCEVEVEELVDDVLEVELDELVEVLVVLLELDDVDELLELEVLELVLVEVVVDDVELLVEDVLETVDDVDVYVLDDVVVDGLVGVEIVLVDVAGTLVVVTGGRSGTSPRHLLRVSALKQ